LLLLACLLACADVKMYLTMKNCEAREYEIASFCFVSVRFENGGVGGSSNKSNVETSCIMYFHE